MKTQKMSLANIKGRLSRMEMKKIMAGSGTTFCSDGGQCSYYESGTGNVNGKCQQNSNNACVCKGPNSSVIWASCQNG